MTPFKTGTFAIFVLVLLGFVIFIAHTSDKQNDMAHQATIVVWVGGHYIRDNYDALSVQVKDGRTVSISDQTLQDKGYLPAGFSLDNPWHQHYQLNITGDPEKPSRLTAFVLTTGGIPIAGGTSLPSIARKIAYGGYISFPADMAFAADSSWYIFLNNYAVKGQEGHLFVWVPDYLLPGGEKCPNTMLNPTQFSQKKDPALLSTTPDIPAKQ